ncbi:MAG: universal stress protein [Acidobacteriia bacterium]|nr:universal stress protein [Terriglobia bacterium]
MLRIQTILFPVDFSKQCNAAASHVSALARHFHAKLTAVHVLQNSLPWYAGLVPSELETTVDITDLLRERKSALDDYLRHEFQDLPQVEKVLEVGDPATLIAEFARSEHADLIMMPTHGYGPFRRLLLGSVTAKVLHDAECPVWTDVHEEVSFLRAGCQSVLCATDTRPEAVASIRWAAAFAKSYGAQLTLIHAIPALAGLTHVSDERFRRHLAAHARAYIDDLRQEADSTARVCIEGGKIAETVRKAAMQYEADVVVIGQGCMHEALGRLRSNAYEIIRESPCPVVRV